ncbi:type II toxin-antitoxin system VapB family antitoxin [Thermococcus sp.]
MNSAVVSIRIPPELRREMKKYDINWSREIREFIRKRIEEEEKKRALLEVIQLVGSLPGVPKGTAKKLVREDRDSH